MEIIRKTIGQILNDISGAATEALAEFRRRVICAYEASMIVQNGDVYPPTLPTPEEIKRALTEAMAPIRYEDNEPTGHLGAAMEASTPTLDIYTQKEAAKRGLPWPPPKPMPTMDNTSPKYEEYSPLPPMRPPAADTGYMDADGDDPEEEGNH